MPTDASSAVQATFSALDWSVVGAYLVVTTVIGARLAGKQSSIRDFFLAGRKLPWWAICGSIVATEVSAAAFLTVPLTSFKAGGSFTYLQLAIGTIIARVLIGFLFVPRYYAEEIYSPYDYMGRRLGPRVKHITTALFMASAVLGQGARIYITAIVFSELADVPLVPAIWIMGGFSVFWTFIGGMSTVIWTDVMQFLILIVGAVAMAWAALNAVPVPVGDVISMAESTGRLQLLDASTDPTRAYTVWTGLLAMPFLNLAAFGLDQVMAQRMFCCRNQRDARRAIIVSCVSQVIPVLMLVVGIGLFAYFEASPFTDAEKARLAKDDTYLVPLFIQRALPEGIRGLLVAAIFAASIATAAIAALSQTTLSLFFPQMAAAGARLTGLRKQALTEVRLSRVLVVFWGAALCVVAVACIDLRGEYPNAIDLVLSIVRYTYGPLLGIFLLAFQPLRRTDAGLFWAVPLAILTIFGMSEHSRWGDYIVWAGCATALILALVYLHRDVGHILVVVVAVLLALGLHRLNFGLDAQGNARYLNPFWHYPIGTILTFVIGFLLGRPARSARKKGPAARNRRAVART